MRGYGRSSRQTTIKSNQEQTPDGLEILMSKLVLPVTRNETTPRQYLLYRYKKHLQAADAQTIAGDRIGAENDYQHAEHFFRYAIEQKDTHRL